MDYLDWKSNLSLEQVFAGTEWFSHPSILANLGILYVGKSVDDNRTVLNLLNAGRSECVTPAPFDLQTRVNEYGGKPYWVFDSSVVFVNKADQCLYRQNLSATGLQAPSRVSCKPDDQNCFMYTDVHQLDDANYLAIIEHESAKVAHSGNQMFIGINNAKTKSRPGIAVKGADFYSNLVVNKAKNKVAWVQWNHPCMPWDDTQLWVADIVFEAGAPVLQSPMQIEVTNHQVKGASICQLLFSNNNRLFFSADFRSSQSDRSSSSPSNYWNVHVYDFSSKDVHRVTSENREYGYPHWVYGDHRIVQFTETELLTVASSVEGDDLVLINQQNLECRRLIPNWSSSLDVSDESQLACTLQHLNSNGLGSCVLEQLPFDANPNLVELKWSANDDSSGSQSLLQTKERARSQRLIKGAELDIEISEALAINYDTRDGKQAHGFYYAPVNSSQSQLTFSKALPPLLVMVHGGPTARAYGHFDLQKQFWTSRGFAILDVNHRGSSGYGRQFRDSLYGEWGEGDASDIVDGILYLIEQKKVDPSRVCIRGKSAGGYAVLRALTEYPEVFRVGACYYGIGNLLTLAESTHKFEKHYTDRLIDEVFDAIFATSLESKFYQRSPINKMSQLKSAMILFQGSLDRVVPPSVAQEVVEVLKSAGIDHDYVEYPNEAHGFKRLENNIDAWQKELQFYQRILRSPTI